MKVDNWGRKYGLIALFALCLFFPSSSSFCFGITSVDQVPCVLPCPTAYVFSLHKFGLTFLASVARESPPLQTFSFLETLAETFQNYFKSDLREDVLLENVSTVYQVRREKMNGSWRV